MTDFDPTTNRIQTMHLTPDELAALQAAKYGWFQVMPSGYKADCDAPIWRGHSVYRAKPAPRPVVMCNGVEVPAPVTEVLAYYTPYWLPCPFKQSRSVLAAWHDRPEDHRRLADGLIYLNEADAVARAKAMLKLEVV